MQDNQVLNLTVTLAPTGQLEVAVTAVVEKLEAARILRQIADEWDPSARPGAPLFTQHTAARTPDPTPPTRARDV